MKTGFRFYILIATLSMHIQCNDVQNQKVQSIDDAIAQLTTDSEKRIYLEKICAIDQKTRTDLSEIEIKYGHDSNERMEAIQLMAKADRLNLQKIERYLMAYGHPTKVKQGELATRAPWLVLHHSGGIEPRERNFTYLYEAYKKGDLKPSSFSFYLERFHRLKFGKRFTLPNPYREDELINALIDRLGLTIPSQ